MSLPPPPPGLPPELREPFARWWEGAAACADLAAAHARAPAWVCAELPRVVACSEFAGAALLRDPAALAWIGQRDEPAAARGWNEACERAAAEAPSAAQAQSALRAWRRRAMLRIAWRDIAGRATVPETLGALSDLADGTIRAAAAATARILEPAFGRPRSADGSVVPLIVVGMGKLGGRELNFSSDVDLVLLYAEAGASDGPRTLDNQEYFQRAGREFIRLLDARTEDGFVFRVDTRLRPFGDSGPLAVSLAALEDYLQQHGRDWERYAWIKARAIVGVDAYEASFRDCVRPFVYRRYLDFGVFESLRDMKALIAREVARRDRDQDLKLGSGGIREIEFIAQSFQLVRGGSDPRLQNAALLDVLPVLAGSKLLADAAVAALVEAYLTLRRAENAVQMIRDEQTHRLPQEEADRARLGLHLGCTDWPATLERIDVARRAVAAQFDALVFAGARAPRDEGRSGTAFGLEAPRIGEELAARGFPAAEISAVAPLLEAYRQSSAYRKLDETARSRLHAVLDRVIDALATRKQPAPLLQRVLRILEAIGARSAYLALLREQPRALARLIDVCAISGFLARQIAEFPLLLDELIDPKLFEELPARSGFAQQLAARTLHLPADDPERQVEALRQFQKAAVFSVALADMTGRLPLMQVSDRLTDIAELIIQWCVDLAWRQITAVHGAPYCGERSTELRAVAIAVIGYGKLGGLELGYGSDLDLVFLHDSTGEVQLTRGARSVDNGVFFLRLGQRIVHLLTMHSAAGRLYEVDMRLRPNGKGGFLMTGIDAFERYQLAEAWTWEHQALLRARAVAGDGPLGARFEAVRRRVLTQAVHRDTLREDVMQMRARMRRELSSAGPGQFDIKQDCGGIADIEFLVQYWVLSAAQRRAELLAHTDNIRQLEALVRCGVVDAATAQWLSDAYRDYRAVLHHLSLEADSARVVDAPPYASGRERIERLWRETFEPAVRTP
ncbi:MAG TPA: bifunctional [glutamate--ammonia ligase]-adenylyl-L-tyrosine phosphorylase/[glutamate--ammonia-ligase] adenylyltransferase [Steroidobacteraceae bacterium]|nr:bifunctional [glutamate--ammonia ligase]-adenylyl-L-tyrosine phosphorylase/[glutamate--ammonia-ligase] adenylyltransferase [Steroidobacteraceae bacterium]